MDEELRQKLLHYSQYLEEIRQRVLGLAIVFIILFFVGFFFSGRFLDYMLHILQFRDVTIVTTSPFQFLNLAMNIGFSLAIIVCIPIAIYHIYSFLRDALRPYERRFFFFLLPLGLFLFVLGFVYGFAILYYTLELIANINVSFGVTNMWDIEKFLSQIIITSALLGVLFLFPLLLSFMLKLRIIDLDFLKSKRRIAYAIIFIIVSLLPPTDGLSLVIMSIPLILMYELTIIMNRLTYRHLVVVNN